MGRGCASPTKPKLFTLCPLTKKAVRPCLQAAIGLTFKQIFIAFTPKPLKISTSILKGGKLCQSDSLVLSQISRACDLNSFPWTLYQGLSILDPRVSLQPHEGINWHKTPSACCLAAGSPNLLGSKPLDPSFSLFRVPSSPTKKATLTALPNVSLGVFCGTSDPRDILGKRTQPSLGVTMPIVSIVKTLRSLFPFNTIFLRC